jgi:hypothetical protein
VSDHAPRDRISTCPNDTFAFHGLMTGAVRVEGAELRLELADVQQLERGLRPRPLRRRQDQLRGGAAAGRATWSC